MERYIGIDSGKFATKAAEYIAGEDRTRKFSLRTKAMKGDFRDDAMEDNTVIIENEDGVFKVGDGASGLSADLDTSKMSEIHKLSTLTAIASVCSSKENDIVNVGTGIPATEWANVEKRFAYKDFILPKGEVHIRIKNNSTAPILDKTFTIKSCYVFPESEGALFMDEMIEKIDEHSITGVLDIGDLNLNATFWEGTAFKADRSTTQELGGAILMQELAQELSANVCACDELMVANIMRTQTIDRHLPEGTNLTNEQIATSREIFKRVIRAHVTKIRNAIRACHWSLDIMPIAITGGTASLIKDEIKEIIGNNAILLPETPYVNAFGYLRMLCAKMPGLKDDFVTLKDTAPSKAQK